MVVKTCRAKRGKGYFFIAISMLILNISTISGGQSFVMQNEVRDCYELGYSSVDQILSLGTC